MYVPSCFEESRLDVLRSLVQRHSLGTLVTLGANGIDANHIPFIFDPEPAPYGTLRAHVARSNPVWRNFSADIDALVVFQGAQSYISPSLHATKKLHGRVVPTYNYMVVHAYGRIRVIEDAASLRDLLGRLSDHHEADRQEPWKIDDAPAEYIEKMMRAIVGIEIPVSRLIGKWKVSQDELAEDRASVEAGLREQGSKDARAVADAVAGHRDGE